MTDYITISGIRKRDFTIQAQMPKISSDSYLRTNEPDTRITRAGDIRITRAGDTRVTRNITTAYPLTLNGTQKRSFIIQAKVKHGN